MSDAIYLLKRLKALDTWRRETTDVSSKSSVRPWQEQDASELVLHVARYLRATVDLHALDLRIGNEGALDAQALREARDILRRAEYDFTFVDGKVFDSEQRLERLDALVETVEARNKFDPLEVMLRISLLGDLPVDALLMAAKDTNALADKLEPLVSTKLALLSDTDAINLLQQYVAETDPARAISIAISEDERRELGSVADASDARLKIARYLLRYRPLAARRTMQKHSSPSLPMLPVGVARVLCWKEQTVDPTQPSSSVLEIAKGLGRLSVIWERLLRRDPTVLANTLDLAPDGALLSAVARKQGQREIVPDWGSYCFVLEALIEAASIQEEEPSAVADALWAYKLGLEVMLPGIHAEYKGKDELPLQRELCRFLVERGIHAYGKSFGSSEIDLRAEDALGTLIIETKVREEPPPDSELRSWLSQLLSYMDQEPVNTRGALVLYNTSKLLITTARRMLFVKQRVYLIPINLVEASPSERRDAIEVVESKDPALLIELRRPISRPGTGRSNGKGAGPS
jgi:hypothetical protein